VFWNAALDKVDGQVQPQAIFPSDFIGWEGGWASKRGLNAVKMEKYLTPIRNGTPNSLVLEYETSSVLSKLFWIYCAKRSKSKNFHRNGNSRSRCYRYYPFPILHRTSSDSMIFQFCSDVGRRPTWLLLRLFARCWSLSDAFANVVRTLANR
jgi:hypothetical protein